MPTPIPVPLDPGIVHSSERANNILAGRGPSPNPISERLSQSHKHALVMVGMNMFAPSQAWSRRQEEMRDSWASMVKLGSVGSWIEMEVLPKRCDMGGETWVDDGGGQWRDGNGVSTLAGEPKSAVTTITSE